MDLNGLWCKDLVKVREEVRKIFEKRFSAPNCLSLNLQNIEFPSISEDDNRILKDIGDHEVEEDINECDGTKSLGLDVCEVVRWFQKEGKIPKGCSASFITLVPKK